MSATMNRFTFSLSPPFFVNLLDAVIMAEVLREPADLSDREREALDVVRVVGQDVHSVLGDNHGVRVSEAADRGS